MIFNWLKFLHITKFRMSGTPTSTYQAMDVVIVNDSMSEVGPSNIENDQVSNHSSNATEKRFACWFDPNQRQNRSLMLRFDLQGNATFEEMSRMDLLRMTHDRIHPVARYETSEEPSKPNFMRPRRFSESKNIIDVQRVHARDIRKLDNAFAVANEPSIVVRKQAILLNADPLRAVIRVWYLYLMVQMVYYVFFKTSFVSIHNQKQVKCLMNFAH